MPALGTEHPKSRNPSSSGNEPTLRSQGATKGPRCGPQSRGRDADQSWPDETPEVPSPHDSAADQKGTENVVTHDPNGICLSTSRNAIKPGQPNSNDHPTVTGRKLGSRDALTSSPGPSLVRDRPMIQDLGPKAPTCQAELKTMAILTAPKFMSSDAPTFLTRNISTMNPTSPYSPWQA